MKLAGDEEGIAQLKALYAKDHSYMKFLVEEARTNTDHTAEFRGANGTRYSLRLDAHSGDLVVAKAKSQRPSKVPGPA